MQVLHRAALTTAVALALGTVPVAAQKYHWEFGVNGGYSWLTGKILDRNDFDFIVDNNVVVGDNLVDTNDRIHLENGGTAGATLGYWFTDTRFGLRANFAWTGSGIDGQRFIFSNDPFDFVNRNLNLWSLTGDVMFHFTKPRTKWDGFEWLPYVALGAGATWVDPQNSDFRLIDDFTVINPLDTNIDVGGRNVALIRCNAIVDSCTVMENNARFTGLGALGMDLRFSPHWTAKLEFADRIWKTDVKRVFVDPEFPFFVVETGDNFGHTVNQLSLTLGVSYLWGLEHPPVQHAAAPPRPAPPPPPPPPPPPSTESITVCVVDPTSAQGVRNITATHNLQTNDTTVTVNGNTMSLSSATSSVPVAVNAPWYVRGAPLEIGGLPNRLQYVSIGSGQMMNPDQLAYLGTVGGMPVFADRQTVPPGLTNLGPNTDLSVLMSQSADAKKAFDTVTTIYVPLQPTGCVFQAMQKMQEVRKNKQEN
jgi:hypothetical protein